MPIELLAAFWAVSALFVITPGADWAYAITAGLQHRSVLPAVGGMLAGHLAAAVLVAAGLAALLTQAPVLLTALTGVGAAYLIHLGLTALRSSGRLHASGGPAAASWLRRARTGFAVSGLNPKVFLLFVALLPQFTDPNARLPLPAQLLALGCVHIASSAVVYTAVATGARSVLQARPAAARAVTRVSGTFMVVIGGTLLAEQLLH